MNKKTSHLSVRVSDDLKERLEAYAKKYEWSVSYAAERIIRNFLTDKNEIVKIAEQYVTESDPQLEYFKISKHDQETLYEVARSLNLSPDQAIRYVLQYFSITWPLD